MGAIVHQTISIPTFPFFNRSAEREIIESFLEQKHGGARVLLLEGPGGIGKSRLLEECINSVSSEVVITVINRREQGVLQRSLVQSLMSEAKQLRSVLAKSNKNQAWKLELQQLGKKFRQVIPSAGSLIPIVGAVTKSALEAALEDRDPALNNTAGWLNHLLAICGLLSIYKPVTIIVDDYHRLTSDDQEVISTLLGSLIEVEGSKLRAVISTRSAFKKTKQVNDSFDLPARNGELISLKLSPLSNEHVRDLTNAIFLNPGSSTPLIDLSEGSPQRLLELMIKLNVNGDLKRQKNLIVLPTDLTALTYLIDSVWSEIEENKTLFDLAAVIAIGTGSITLTDIDTIATALGYASKEILHAATILEQLGIFTLNNENGIQSIRFSHDTLQEQIAARIEAKSKISFVYFNDVTARYLEKIISKMPISKQTPETDILSLKIARAHCLRNSSSIGWEELSLVTAQECLKSARFCVAVELVSPIIDTLSQTLRPQTPELLNARSIQVRCCYSIGEYEAISSVTQEEVRGDPYAQYAVAMSIIIEKKPYWYRDAIKRLDGLLDDSEYEVFAPLFESARAIALRENDDVIGGEEILDQLVERGSTGIDPVVWHQFLAITSVFRNDGSGFMMAEAALNFFDQSRNVRMAGVAATNLAILSATEADFERALQVNDRAESYFKEIGSEDVIFPLLNRAAILLTTGQADRALPQLRSCLFRKLPSERRLSVLNNLALAQWFINSSVDLQQLQNEAITNENAWLRWISRLNIIFLELDGGRAAFDYDKLASYRIELLKDDPDKRSAPFWNWILDRYEQKITSDLRINSEISVSPLEGLAQPDRGVGRPVFLSFGRI